MTTSGNEWQRVVQRVVQRVITNDNEWLFRRPIFFFFREDSSKRHPDENPLNLEEDFEENLLN